MSKHWNTVQDYLDCDNHHILKTAMYPLRPRSQEERAHMSRVHRNRWIKRRLLNIRHRALNRWELRILERIRQGLPAYRTQEEIEKSLWSPAQRQRHSLRMKAWSEERRAQGLPMGGHIKRRRRV